MDLLSPNFLGTQMIDLSSKGLRCRAARELRTNWGRVASFTEGTIEYEIMNLGRKLILVEWDNGLSAYVYPNEIEIIDGGLSWH